MRTLGHCILAILMGAAILQSAVSISSDQDIGSNRCSENTKLMLPVTPSGHDSIDLLEVLLGPNSADEQAQQLCCCNTVGGPRCCGYVVRCGVGPIPGCWCG